MTTEVRHSVCALDCPDCCSLLINVDLATGEGSRLRGNPDHPVTRGFLCGKVARYLEREYSPQRLLYPMRRAGAKGEGRFERISWENAIDEIAARLKDIAARYGSESILPYSYAGTMGYLNGSGMDRRFFHRLGASRLDRTICSSAGGAGLVEALGVRYGVEPEQFPKARLILAWGANVMGTNVHLWPFILEARRQGARFYVIDPIATKTAKLADRHYAPHPGSDLALALGLMHVILAENLQDQDYIDRYTSGFASLKQRAAEYPPQRVAELTGIPAGDIVALAREYATTKPAVIRLNYGLQRTERGGKAVQAIALLPALTGAWRHAGGGLQLTTSGAFLLNRNALERPDLQEISLGREARLVNMSSLGRALTELDQPPVQAMVVYNSNPAAIAPNQNLVLRGLRREDLFTVVLEQFPTDTTDFADIVLPVTTFLEHQDLYFAYGHYYLQLAEPALAPPGECKSNVEIFRLLAQRMGFTEPELSASEDQMILDLLNTGHPFLRGITLDRLKREKSIRLAISNPGEPFLPFAEGGFKTSDGKCNLNASTLDYVPPVESRLGSPELRSRYPLELVSSKFDDAMNSTFGYREETRVASETLHMHPEDAASRGIADGNIVQVHNDRGRCLLHARIGNHVRPGVVRAPAVGWNKLSLNGQGINALTSDRLTDIGGGPTFYNCLVEVQKCANPNS